MFGLFRHAGTTLNSSLTLFHGFGRVKCFHHSPRTTTPATVAFKSHHLFTWHDTEWNPEDAPGATPPVCTPVVRRTGHQAYDGWTISLRRIDW